MKKKSEKAILKAQKAEAAQEKNLLYAVFLRQQLEALQIIKTQWQAANASGNLDTNLESSYAVVDAGCVYLAEQLTTHMERLNTIRQQVVNDAKARCEWIANLTGATEQDFAGPFLIARPDNTQKYF
ncbi:MAG: hypothetical protein RLZ35_1082 [Pseudomonadota bacterium]|jgi:hypothetical protein